MEYDCLILGAGLTGLYAALHLQQRGLLCAVLEARDRLGGRVLGLPHVESGESFDLGPTWLWPEFQPLIARLAQTLEIPLFGQQTNGAALYEDAEHPAPLRIDGESPNAHSYRVVGGAARLIGALEKQLTKTSIHTGRRVVALENRPDHVDVRTTGTDGSEEHYTASHVVSTIPLRLLADSVEFVPALPSAHAQLFATTPTWMAAHAKFIAFFDSPFWRAAELSGEVFSRRGPLTEIYDASPLEGGPYALFGFFGLVAHARSSLGREALAQHSLEQLERLFGKPASNPLSWEIKDWSTDSLTATAADATPPAGHPAYGLPEQMLALWDGRLVFAGSETSTGQGGYLEGALESAVRASSLITSAAE
ncbi:flavin monoamine oxidase family protein [Acidihalobacter prosperus]